MKMLLAVLCLFSSFPAFADEAWPHACAASGQVELLTKRGSDTVFGHINHDSVEFTRYQGLIYGDYRGNQVVLNVNGNEITGTIGNEQVRLEYRGGVARGFLLCID